MSTMTPMSSVLVLLFAHWFGDFVCQTRWQGNNKSKDIRALAAHVLTYSTVLIFTSLVLFNPVLGLFYAIMNGCLHFVVDFFTSRLTAKLWAEKLEHGFWSIIGLDQFIHGTCLIVTGMVLFGWK